MLSSVCKKLFLRRVAEFLPAKEMKHTKLQNNKIAQLYLLAAQINATQIVELKYLSTYFGLEGREFGAWRAALIISD
jgi:hypothetical protein